MILFKTLHIKENHEYLSDNMDRKVVTELSFRHKLRLST